MKRKQKRFLQMTLLFMVALIFLPNVGLWSLYKDKHLVKSTEPGEQQVSAIRRKLTGLVRHATRGDTRKQVWQPWVFSQVFAGHILQDSRLWGLRKSLF